MLLGLTGFQLVLLGFIGFLLGFYWVLLGFTGFPLVFCNISELGCRLPSFFFFWLFFFFEPVPSWCRYVDASVFIGASRRLRTWQDSGVGISVGLTPPPPTSSFWNERRTSPFFFCWTKIAVSFLFFSFYFWCSSFLFIRRVCRFALVSFSKRNRRSKFSFKKK